MKARFVAIEAEGDVGPALALASQLIGDVRGRNEERRAEQLGLPLDRPRGRRSHRVADTSKSARELSATQQLRDRLLVAIQSSRVGFTADEAAHAIGADRDLKSLMTARRRVSDLAKRAQILETEHRRTNADGNPQIVWRATNR